MARPVKMDHDFMLSLTQAYYAEKCNGDPKMLKIPKIGEYIRSKGYEINDYLIRRNSKIIEYINCMNEKNEQKRITIVSVFRDMDVDEFLKKNYSLDKMKKALIERQNYYMEVAHSASLIIEENKKLKTKINKLEKELSELEEELESTSLDRTEVLKGFHDAKKKARVLMDLVDTYLYPEIANELLAQKGIIRKNEGVVDTEKLSNEIVTAETDITKLQNNIVRSLFDVFKN